MALARIRSIQEACTELKKEDPSTSIGVCMIREMCNKGIIKNFKAGKKIFLDYDDLVEKINSFTFSI